MTSMFMWGELEVRPQGAPTIRLVIVALTRRNTGLLSGTNHCRLFGNRKRAKLTHDARVFIGHPVRPSNSQTRRHINGRRGTEPCRWCRGKRSDLQRRVRDARPAVALCRRGSPGDASFDESLARCVMDDGCAGEPARLAGSDEIVRGHRGLSMVERRSHRRRSQRAAARTLHHAGVLQSSRHTCGCVNQFNVPGQEPIATDPHCSSVEALHVSKVRIDYQTNWRVEHREPSFGNEDVYCSEPADALRVWCCHIAQLDGPAVAHQQDPAMRERNAFHDAGDGDALSSDEPRVCVNSEQPLVLRNAVPRINTKAVRWRR